MAGRRNSKPTPVGEVYMEWWVVRNKLGLVILALAFGGLSGCSSVPNAVNPISWYRDVTGAAKNDDLGQGQNQQNLDEGSNEPFPNLANVPPAPDSQLSGVARHKLVDSLIADRNHAQYSADNLHAGEGPDTVPPPVPSSPPAATRSAVTASPTAAPAQPVNATLPPASPIASASPTAPPPSASTVNSAAANPTASAQRRPPTRGSEAPPAESTLQAPAIHSVPQGEAVPPAPPPPRLSAPHAVASAAPRPAPTRLKTPKTPMQQASAPANVTATAPSHRPAISYRIADVSFAPGSAFLSGALRGTIAEVVKLHNDEGGTIRILGFGEASGKDAAIAGLTLALDRAQAVAIALTDSGVAAKDIAVEAAPVPARGGADAPRAEVYLEQ